MKLIKLIAGFISGFTLASVFSWIVVNGLFAPDEVQNKIAKKTKCKTYKELLSLYQTPEEKLQFVEKHKNIIKECNF